MRYFGILIGLFFVISCARQGAPSGGPKDVTPPKFLSSFPDTLSLNVPIDLQEIRINFDEYIVLKDHTQNIITSPPFEVNPTYMPVGTPSKSIRIKLNEPLKENTTYNINFGNSIQDHNEGNKLPYFQMVFSTGESIDSLEIKGKLEVPFLRKQPKNLLVGLYRLEDSYNDSLITSQKPFYIAKADAEGNFKLNYLHEGSYQLIAFDDEVQNLQFDRGKEMFGFADEPIELYENQSHNIQLFHQIDVYKAGKAEQKGYGHLVFRFSGEAEEIKIRPLNHEFTTSEISYKPKSDSLNFWFKPAVDSISDKSKRLNFITTFKDQIDTISVLYNTNQKHTFKLERFGKLEDAPSRKINFKVNSPITKLDSSLIEVWKDSIQLQHAIILNSESKNEFAIDFKVEQSSNYKITFLPNAIHDFFDESNDSMEFIVKTKGRNDLGNLHLKLEGKPPHPFWIQLLNEKDEVLEERYTTESDFEFNFLLSGNYYFKILVDENENGHWDSGDFFERKQAEKSYVYPTLINVRPLWDMNETWILTSTRPENINVDETEKTDEESNNDFDEQEN